MKKERIGKNKNKDRRGKRKEREREKKQIEGIEEEEIKRTKEKNK